MITNFCILNDIKSQKDQYCLSVRVRRQEEQLLILEVQKDDPAPCINYREHPDTFNILNVREGQYPELSLLSGGILIFEENDYSLAMGKRNENSVDPLCWTNMVAGRCDAAWEMHIKEELGEEFILHYKNSKNEYISLIPEILDNPENIFKSQQVHFPQLKTYRNLNFNLDETGDFLKLNQKRFWKKIQIYQPGQLDEFEAIVYYDEKNRTFEIRQPAVVNFSDYKECKLLFPEGAREAEWFPVSQLKYQREKEKADGKQRFVPFIQFFLDHY